VLGWRTILQLLALRAAESTAFSVPDRNALWSRAEDGLLMPAVAKYSTLDVLGRNWREVASKLPGRLPQQCKERYRLADTVAQLTFVFLRVTFRGSTSLLCVCNDSPSEGSDTAYASPTSPSSISTKRTSHLPRTHPPHAHILTLIPMLTILAIACTQVHGFFSQPKRPCGSFCEPYDL
jgi:hypothetical protein